MFKKAMSRVDRLRQMHNKLIAEHIRIETQQMLSEGMILALKLQLRKSVTKELADLTKDISAAIAANQGTTSNWQDIANELRESAVGSVRSISHKLWSQQPITPFPHLTPFDMTRILFLEFIQSEEVLAELESKIEASVIQVLSTEQLTFRFNKDLAQYLHGNLQSRLLATAFAIETAGAISNDIELSAQLEVARQALARPFDHYFEMMQNSFTAEIKNLTDHWGALLLTSLVFSSSDDQFSENESRAALLCIEEGLANALHHGHASEVAITVTTTKTMHVLSLIDNGIGPTSGLPGLGSSLFNSCAGSSWSLNCGPEGIGAKLILQITR